MDKLPDNLKPVSKVNGRTVVMDGEHTGHAHATKDEVQLFEDSGGRKYLVSDGAFEIVHEEHKTQVIEPGVYEIGVVQEYDYDEEAARAVQD